ncbi:MAG TPA: hypothetical protein VK658_05080, partial [Chryseolinea sp.]|nr:hypothetical protein [Chryseolinea sp.]
MSGFLRLVNFAAIVLLMSFCTRNEREQVKSELSKKELRGTSIQDTLFAKGKELGALKNKKLNEVSGLAASVANPGMLWTHNDSGNDAEVYLIDLETNIKQTYVLKGVSNRDWEEIALGPGPEPGAQYVYVGDIGDNMAIHKFKYIYRFREPVYKSGTDKAKIDITDFETIAFSLSDERRDTEAFVVDPETRDIYIISKWKSPSDLYRLKYSNSTHDTLIAEHIGTLPISTVVAADFSRDGTELLVKTYNSVFYWKRSANTSVLTMLQKPGTPLPYRREPQGEAVTWSTNGNGFYTLSEQKKREQ